MEQTDIIFYNSFGDFEYRLSDFCFGISKTINIMVLYFIYQL